jgi:6-pyruvoyltetrahydropterin/6-carboxytetrahydropterin synthase
MIELCRTIRFCLGADGSLATDAGRDNTFAAWPPMRGLGRYYELMIVCRGEPDAATGYFMNIKQIDEAARSVALPAISKAAQSKDAPIGSLLREIVTALDHLLAASVAAAELRLTPTYGIRLEKSFMNQALLSQRYEFSASHRLHAPGLSDAENRRIFGKCNNPAGHGHNYQLEVTVRAPLTDEGNVLPVESLDALVNHVVVEKLDHKHLDIDVPQFRGINTTVENIARVIFEMLTAEISSLGVDLEQVRVWETGKTVCTYRGATAPAR